MRRRTKALRALAISWLLFAALGIAEAGGQEEVVDVVVHLETAPSGILEAKQPFYHEASVLWWTAEAFHPIKIDLESLPPLMEELEALREYRQEANLALNAAKRESDALRGQVDLIRENYELQREVAANNYAAFIETDELLEKERRRNTPLVVHGPSIGIGIPVGLDGEFEFDNVSVFLGYAVTFNLNRKR